MAQKQRMMASMSATPLAVAGSAYAVANSLPRRASSRQIELAGAADASEAPLHPPQKQRECPAADGLPIRATKRSE